MTAVSARSTLARREARRFHLFVSPWVIGFVLFSAGPILGAIVLSFMDWNLLKPPTWVGLANYERMFTDPEFWESIENTVQYGLGSVALGVSFTFLLALLLNQPLRFQGLFRTVMYLPSVVSGLATAMQRL
jgi:multiple sugar transport system permease protein